MRRWAIRGSQGVAGRLLVAILLFSSVVTVTLTVAQLYLDYKGQLQAIEARFDEIGTSSLPSLGASLWALDRDHLQLQIEGILNRPDIRYVEVYEVGQSSKRSLSLAVGERGQRRGIGRHYPVRYGDARSGEPPKVIGNLYVEASLDGVYDRLSDKALAILINQGVKTFVVSVFTLFIVHQLVTRHLIAIGAFVRHYSLGRSPSTVSLARRKPGRADELDDLVAALNSMSAGLAESVDEREEALRQLRLQEAALNRAHRLFTTRETAAKLAHEIKQPLACVSTYVQGLQAMVRKGTLRVDELPQLADRLCREVARIGEIMAASQDAIDRPGTPHEPLDLVEAIEDVAPLLRQICDDHGVTVELALGAGPLMVRGSRTALQQVAVNLLRNGCQAMVAQPEATRHLRLELAALDRWIELVVSDSGPGFPPRILATGHSLFASTKPAGKGLGLPIASAIAKSHGGSLQISNDERGGGRVTCRLPVPDRGFTA